MRRARIRVKVQPGMFPRELSVSFEVGGKSYTLIVDERDVQKVGEEGWLNVYVVEQGDKEAVIDLPRDTFTSGNRVRVPSDYVQYVQPA